MLDAIATALTHVFAGRVGLHNLGSALFWVSAQLTTVSSQMPNPVTTARRVVDVLLEIWAMSVVATVGASLSNFSLARHAEALRGDGSA